MKCSVLLADDHAIVRGGLASLLSLSGEFGPIWQAADGVLAVEAAVTHRPDMLVIDLLMPNMPGVEAIGAISRRCPDVHIVVLTSSQDDALAYAALEAGARSFLLKTMSGEEILQALKQIAHGEHVIHAAITTAMLRMVRRSSTAKNTPLVQLTPREIDVLLELAQGASNAKIALALNITERTVKAHLGACLAKLGLADRTEAVAFAWRNGLIKAPGEAD